MQNIIGREEEMGALRRCMESDRSEFVIVYGRRRVGKTFLVDSFFEGKYDFSYVGGYKFGFEILIVNGLLTFLALWAFSKKNDCALK